MNVHLNNFIKGAFASCFIVPSFILILFLTSLLGMNNPPSLPPDYMLIIYPVYSGLIWVIVPNFKIRDLFKKKKELNIDYETLFRKKSFEIVKESWDNAKLITKTELKIMVRKDIGCSSSSSYSYMERLFIPIIGPLVVSFNMLDGSYFVKFNNKKDYNLSLEDLENKYPKSSKKGIIENV